MDTKKRILVFIPEFPVLTETFIEREITKLVERGNVDLTVFSLLEGKGSVSEILKDRVVYNRPGIGDIFTIIPYYFSNFSQLNKIFSDFRKREKTSSGEGDLENLGFFKEFYTFFKSVIYAKKFSKYKPDLLLAHFLSEPSTIAMHASKVLEIPYAISAHAKDILVTSEYTREKVQTSKFITICNDNAYAHVLNQAKGLGTSNVYLKYHGVDVQGLIKSVENKDFRPKKPLIFCVGRLVEKKGLKYLIEATSILKSKGISFLVNIVGSGPLYQELLNQIKSENLEEDVEILGENKGLSNEDTLIHFKSASIFSFPSIKTDEGDVDGVANVLIEAGVFKVPVVTTDAGGIGELITNDITGLVVPQRNSEMLAEKIELLLQDRSLGKKLGENLYNKVLEKFDLDTNIVELENLLLKN